MVNPAITIGTNSGPQPGEHKIVAPIRSNGTIFFLNVVLITNPCKQNEIELPVKWARQSAIDCTVQFILAIVGVIRRSWSLVRFDYDKLFQLRSSLTTGRFAPRGLQPVHVCLRRERQASQTLPITTVCFALEERTSTCLVCLPQWRRPCR